MSACSVVSAVRGIARFMFLWLLCSAVAWSQTQTTGRIAGTVQDVQDAAIVGAQVAVENSSTGDKRTATRHETRLSNPSPLDLVIAQVTSRAASSAKSFPQHI